MINIYRKTVTDKKIQKIEAPQKGAWIYVAEPTEADISYLVDTLKLERGHITDALDPYETPRLETEGTDSYVYLRFPVRTDEHIVTMPILFIIREDTIVTVLRASNPLFDDFTEERAKISTTQKTKFLISAFLKINSLYREYLGAISRNIRAKRDVLENVTQKDIVDFVKFEDVLNDFTMSLVPAGNIYQSLLGRGHLEMYKYDEDLIKDLMLSNTEALDICKTNIKTISSIREAYSTIITNRLNKTIKFLTAITIILTAPTVIASIYGMNIRLPMQDHPQSFVVVLGVTFALMAAMYAVFYKKDWL